MSATSHREPTCAARFARDVNRLVLSCSCPRLSEKSLGSVGRSIAGLSLGSVGRSIAGLSLGSVGRPIAGLSLGSVGRPAAARPLDRRAVPRPLDRRAVARQRRPPDRRATRQRDLA
jgi:hypothetical protein